MDEQDSILAEIESLLWDMYELAQQAAQDGRRDSERQVLQERLAVLREMVDEAADRLKRAAPPDGGQANGLPPL